MAARPKGSSPVAAADRVTRPQARTAAKRQSILDAALRVFGTRGYNNAALAEIAAEAGMTHAGVLHHFGSKERLLVAVLQYRDGVEAHGVAAREQIEGPSFLEHVLGTVEENVGRPGVVQTYAVLSAESVTDGHPAQEYFRGRFATLRTKLAGVFAEVSGRSPKDPEVTDAASAFIATMDGLQVQWLLDPDAVDMPRTVALVLDELVDRLAKKRPAPSAIRRARRVLAETLAEV